MGVTSGLIAAFLGLGDFGMLNTFLSYAAVGIGTDLALLLLHNRENLLVATLAAVVGRGLSHLRFALSKTKGVWGL